MLKVHLCLKDVKAEELAGSWVVVIDLIRATTTACYALAAGAEAMFPVASLQEARRRHEQLGSGGLLCGEQGGLPPEGFDLGNSPREYTPQRVAGRKLVFLTTNGTVALGRCEKAAWTGLASLVNFSTVARRVQKALEHGQPVHLLCAGVRGQPALEDTLVAGALIGQLRLWGEKLPGEASAQQALEAWNQTAQEVLGRHQIWPWRAQDAHSLARFLLHHTPGGKNLARVGLQEDLQWCTQVDRFTLLPAMHPQQGLVIRSDPQVGTTTEIPP